MELMKYQWIPCKETMPIDLHYTGPCWITTSNLNVCNNIYPSGWFINPDIAKEEYKDELEQGKYKLDYNITNHLNEVWIWDLSDPWQELIEPGHFEKCYCGPIIAWMPFYIPDPYKG